MVQAFVDHHLAAPGFAQPARLVEDHRTLGSADRKRAQDTAGIEAAALSDAAFNLDQRQLTVSSSTDAAVSYLQVTVDYPFSTIIPYPAIPKRINLSRTVRMEVVPATPVFH